MYRCALQIFCLFGADKDTDLSYTYDVEEFTADTPSSPKQVRSVMLPLSFLCFASTPLPSAHTD